MESQDTKFTNDVFISYSRQDKAFATKLVSALKNYKPPRDLNVSHRPLKVFIDTDDFRLGDYDKRLLNHLKDSAKLLVICSPTARDSPYVNDEVRTFGKLRCADHIVPVLIAGVPNNECNNSNAAQMAFPSGLCEIMPLPLAASYVSFDPRKDNIQGSAFIQSWYTLLAGIYDVSRAEIEQREYKRRIRSRRMIYSLFTLFALIIVTVLAVVLFQAESGSKALLEVESRYQSQLVQDKARQIELYGQRYRDVVVGLARAFEISGSIQPLNEEGYDQRLQATLHEDPNLVTLALWPVNGDLQRAFQPDVIKLEEVDARVNEVVKYRDSHEVIVSRPEIIRSGQEMALTIASPVLGNKNEVIGHVIAIVSCQEIFDVVVQPTSKSERELLDGGLPVVFVVDKDGKAIAHPEASVAFSEKSMTNLKVVQDWLESGTQVQSALAPFSRLRDGQEVDMLGSFATVELSTNSRLGVIAIQDQAAALQSVDEMRWRGRVLAIVAIIVVISQIGLAFFLKIFYYDMRYGSWHTLWHGIVIKLLYVPERLIIGTLRRFWRAGQSRLTYEPQRFLIGSVLVVSSGCIITGTVGLMILTEFSIRRQNFDEESVISILRTLHSAEATYQAMTANGGYGTLSQLQDQNLISGFSSEGIKNGYRFTLILQPIEGEPRFEIRAEPQGGTLSPLTGRSFYLNESGVIYMSDGIKAGSRDHPGSPLKQN